MIERIERAGSTQNSTESNENTKVISNHYRVQKSRDGHFLGVLADVLENAQKQGEKSHD